MKKGVALNELYFYYSFWFCSLFSENTNDFFCICASSLSLSYVGSWDRLFIANDLEPYENFVVRLDLEKTVLFLLGPISILLRCVSLFIS